MARTSLPEPLDTARPEGEGPSLLLDVARRSIEQGVRTGAPLLVEPDDYPSELREERATFVTLRRAHSLRGCIGELEARQPLVVSVAETAFKSAFQDPRFAPLAESELEVLAIEISILSPLEPLDVRSEEELLQRIRPGVDGLVLRKGRAQGTYLPSVWAALPDPREFVAELKRKAGLTRSHWSSDLEVSRFSVESIS